VEHKVDTFIVNERGRDVQLEVAGKDAGRRDQVLDRPPDLA
jgi:hypothetical protein